MKKQFLAVIAIALFTLSFTSCREKTTGEKVENAVENVGNDLENAIDN